ncbi:amidohydrolase family protein [Aquimarina gracilis]|uniref:Amidohydrolase family protein n=1 Tax=Aquimarina gracilis TaxID=874422 RepID=A0ABU5ZWB7_9FLAO|nr:amidohydrolase family protein [Aquimarina gracilis]MEB3346138.1 amidohydrolase family protein [Aquimarina gracilis]
MKKGILFCILFVVNTTNLISQSTLIKNTTIIDVVKEKIIPNQNILIDGETISAISSKNIKVKENTIIIDGTDKFILPGMIDTHIHFFQTGSLYTRPDALDLKHVFSYEDEIQFAKDIIPDNFKRYLRLGITSVMDMGGPFFNFTIRDSIAKNDVSPNVYVTGPLFSPYQPKAFSELEDTPIKQINSIAQATALFNKMISYKPDFIKIWYITSKKFPAEKTYPIVKHIASLTHKNGLPLAIHATDLKTAKLAIKAGANILVHSVRDEIVDKEFIDLLKNNSVTYIPTLIVSKNYGKSFLGKPDNHPQDLAFAHPSVYRSLTDMNKLNDTEVPERIRKLRKDRKWLERRYQKADSIMFLNLKILTDNKINIATGTDAGNIGTIHASSYIQEIEAMQKSGISNMNIIKASTLNAAKGFGLDNKLGSITEEKLADLIILNKNPIENIQNLNTIYEVIKSGKVLDIKNLIQETPEQIVQRQVNAYNARDINAFMATYADDIKIYHFPDKLVLDGKEKMRQQYKSLFERVPNLYCEIKNRITLDNKVVDREHVRINDKNSDLIAIYEINDGKISKITFIK